MTILLLFVTLSSELMALDIPTTNEVELVIEEDKSEKELEQHDVIITAPFQLLLLDLTSIKPTTPFLENYLFKDTSYRPPIS